jgi:hypothetical protein
VADVLRCEASRLARRHVGVDAERIQELLARAMPRKLRYPLEVHLELWRAEGALDAIIELCLAAGRQNTGGGAAPASVAGFGSACLADACAAHAAQLAVGGCDAHAWLCTAQRIRHLGAAMLAALPGTAAPPALGRLALLSDIVTCLFGSLQADARMARRAAADLAAYCSGTADAAAVLEHTCDVLARIQSETANQDAVQQLETCAAAVMLRVLDDGAPVGSPAFNAVCAEACAASWGVPGDTEDEAAGPPLLAAVLERLVRACVAGDDLCAELLTSGGRLPAALSAPLSASLESGTAPAVLLVDALQRTAAVALRAELASGDGTARAVARLRRAVTLVAQDRADEHNVLRLLAAVAFVKAFCAHAAALMTPDLLATLDGALPRQDAGASDDGSPARAIKLLLLRELQHARGLSTQGCAAACRTPDGQLARLLPCVLHLPWPLPAATCLGFNPWASRPQFGSICDNLQRLAVTGEAPPALAALSRTDEGIATLLLAAASTTLLAAAPPSQSQRTLLAHWCAAQLGGSGALLGSLAQHVCLRAQLPLACARAAPGDEPLLASLLLHLAAVAPPGPLRDYCTPNQRRHVEDYVLAGQGRGDTFQRMKTELQAGPFVRYQCACGYVYAVGNCGRTSATGVCVVCSRDIGNVRGGNMHNAVATFRLLEQSTDQKIQTLPQLEQLYPEQPGAAPLSAADARLTMHTERNLPPAIFRLLHLLVQLALAASALAPGAAAGEANQLWSAAHDDWSVLTQLLPGCTRDGLCMLLHHVIATCIPARPGLLRDAATRDAWELDFAARVRPVLATLPATLARCAAAYADGQRGSVALEEQLTERGAGYDASWRPALMRCIALPSFGDLANQFAATPGAAAALPLLAHALKPNQAAVLRQAALLWPLLRWVQLAFRKLNHKITRAQSLECDVAALLDSDDARSAYADFVAAWEVVRRVPVQLGCEAIPEMEAMPADGRGVRQALFCVAPTGAGAMLYAVLCHVAKLHNSCVAELTLLVPTCAPLQFRSLGGGTAGLRPVRLMALQAGDTLAYNDATEAALAACSRPHLGAGRVLRYDLAAAEAKLAAALGGAALVQYDEVAPLRFQGEAFHADATALAQLCARVRQDEGTLPGHDALAHALRTSAAPHAFALLAALESLCFFAGRAGGAPGDSLLALADAWLAPEERAALLLVPGIRTLRLEHFEALFLAVEGALAPALAATVDGEYKTEVPPAALSSLRALCRVREADTAPLATAVDAATQAHARAAALADALQRFVARHLAGEAPAYMAPDNALRQYLDLFAWQPEARRLVRELQDGLPAELQLRHAHSACRHLCAVRDAMRARAECRSFARVAEAAAASSGMQAGRR